MSLLKLDIKQFSFSLKKELITSKGVLKKKEGWLICLKNSFGQCGWGEISPLNAYELKTCANILNNLRSKTTRAELEEGISIWPKALGFGFGAAFALDKLLRAVKLI